MPLWSTVRAPAATNQTPAEPQPSGLSALERFFLVNPLREVYRRVKEPGGPGGILERLLLEMRIEVRVTPEDLLRVPEKGAALVVANHPFGILDGVILGAILTRSRKDVKILSNYLVAEVEDSPVFASIWIHSKDPPRIA